MWTTLKVCGMLNDSDIIVGVDYSKEDSEYTSIFFYETSFDGTLRMLDNLVMKPEIYEAFVAYIRAQENERFTETE